MSKVIIAPFLSKYVNLPQNIQNPDSKLGLKKHVTKNKTIENVLLVPA